MTQAIILPYGCAFSSDQSNSIDIVVHELNRISRFKNDLTIVADHHPNPLSEIDVIQVRADGGRQARTCNVINALRKIDDLKLIECHQHIPTAAKIARAFPDIPSILYRHNKVNAKGWITGIPKRRQLSAFDRIVFVSQAAKKDFDRDYPMFSERSFAISNGIDTQRWYAPVDGKDRLLSFVGRPNSEKGFAQLCAGFDRILSDYPDWSALIIAGPWEETDYATNALEPVEQNHPDRVTAIRGTDLDAVIQHVKKSAISVVPSVYFETYGLVAAEAHAAGAAVVSSGTGGLPEVSGDHAVYLDAVTPEHIYRAVADLIDNPKKRIESAKAGQDYVRQHHDISVKTEKLDNLRDILINHY
jgi:glycosyltransferase involved in cell wall biosynthesis